MAHQPNSLLWTTNHFNYLDSLEQPYHNFVSNCAHFLDNLFFQMLFANQKKPFWQKKDRRYFYLKREQRDRQDRQNRQDTQDTQDE